MSTIKYVVNGHDLPHGFTNKSEALKYFKSLSGRFKHPTLTLVEQSVNDHGVYLVFIDDAVFTKIETWKLYREGVALGYNDPKVFALNHELVE